MKTIRIILGVFCCLLLFDGYSFAHDELENVWLLKSHGTWKLNKRYGKYRVLVIRELYKEHAFDKVKVEIVEKLPEAKIKVLRSFFLDTPGYQGYVQDVFFKQVDDRKIAISIDIEMKAMAGIVMREVYLVSFDGKIRQINKAKYTDIFD